MHITHFKSAPEFRAWLRKHHAAATELLPGFYRKDSGLGGITCAEALDEALCHGWIDGVRRKVDEVTVRHPLFATQALQHLEQHQCQASQLFRFRNSRRVLGP